MNATVDRLPRREIRDTTKVLARSFDDSPLMRHCIPNDRRRPSILRSFFRASIRNALPFDNVFVARDGDRVLGAAVWLPPGCYPPSNLRQLRQLTGTIMLGPLAPRAVQPSLRYLRAAEKAHPKASHWYLAVLGVDPAFQGRGLGGRLLRPVLERADAEEMPVYLETDKERNLAFYARFRFGLVDTLHPDGDAGPPEWTLWRDPKPA
ncbi:MAG: GNAT family N-acetyltransferase [Acidimicrobiia bacterium]